MFLCRHCKYVQHVKQALTTLGREYQGTDPGIVAISANDATAYAEDAPESLKAMAVAESFTYPFCYDESQAVAKKNGEKIDDLVATEATTCAAHLRVDGRKDALLRR